MSNITIRNVKKCFGDTVVLRDFTQEFREGEFITLLGPSGCGKTTMLRMIAGFERPTQGEIAIGEQVVSSKKVFIPPEKRDIGMVFQSYAVWPHMTVFDNVAYPLRIKKLPKGEVEHRVEALLQVVHLGRYAQRMPGQLSGGQQQRVAIGRVIVREPKVLLMDEPLSNLDAKLREGMRYEIKEIQRELGITVVYVTHDQTEAMAMSDRIVVINRGVIQQVGTPQEIYRTPANQFVADFVGRVDFLRGAVRGGRIQLTGLGQSLRYDGPCTGEVVVAVRPESLSLARPGEGQLTGSIVNKYYLGDISDLRVDVGGAVIRLIAPPEICDTMERGAQVALGIREFLVFPDDGTGESLRILT